MCFYLEPEILFLNIFELTYLVLTNQNIKILDIWTMLWRLSIYLNHKKYFIIFYPFFIDFYSESSCCFLVLLKLILQRWGLSYWSLHRTQLGDVHAGIVTICITKVCGDIIYFVLAAIKKLNFLPNVIFFWQWEHNIHMSLGPIRPYIQALHQIIE